MDLRKLKALIDLVEKSGIAELEITEGEEKVRIAKQGGMTTAPTYIHHAAAPAHPAPVAAPAPAAEPVAALPTLTSLPEMATEPPAFM